MTSSNPLAVITAASTGIGFHLASLCAQNGFDVIVAGAAKKDDAADVAAVGFRAMMKGEGQVIAGSKNKLQAAAAHVLPAAVTADMHRGMAEPGTAR